jgi:hypothetical protein
VRLLQKVPRALGEHARARSGCHMHSTVPQKVDGRGEYIKHTRQKFALGAQVSFRR